MNNQNSAPTNEEEREDVSTLSDEALMEMAKTARAAREAAQAAAAPAEAAQAEKDKDDIAAALAKAKESYDFDNPEAHRRGFN